jgi:hypothetical protein
MGGSLAWERGSDHDLGPPRPMFHHSSIFTYETGKEIPALFLSPAGSSSHAPNSLATSSITTALSAKGPTFPTARLQVRILPEELFHVLRPSNSKSSVHVVM